MTRFLSSSPTTTTLRGGGRPGLAWILFIGLTIGGALLVDRAAAFCPSGCICDERPILRAACVNLDDVPIQMNPELRVIDLSMNQIRHVNYTFAFYGQLQLLNLTQNRIDILGSNNFRQQSELRVLDLSTNGLQHLSKDAFRGLTKLQRLLLNDNHLQNIHHHALPGLAALAELNLANNKLTHLAAGTLESLTGLRVLVLENNKLLDVPGSANFQHLPSLVFLNLRSNLIRELSADGFRGLQRLEYLHLGDNEINQVDEEAFAPLRTLRWLSLADNNLTMVPSKQMSKLTNLTNLSLNGNTFSQLPPVALPNLSRLRELHLDRLMHLTTIAERALVDNSRLQILSLAHNPQLGQLPVRLLHSEGGEAGRLDLRLQNNALTTLDAAQLPGDRVRRLRLAGNPLVCNCSLAWLWRLIDATTPPATLTTASLAVDNGPGDRMSSSVAAKRTMEDAIALGDDSFLFGSADSELAEAAIKASTDWDWATAARRDAADNELVVEDMHRITCDLLASSADGTSRSRRRFIDLQETDVECAQSVLLTVAGLVVLLLCVVAGGVVWLCRKRHLERLLAKHDTDRPIDPWPLDSIEKFEIARDMDRLEYEIRQMDYHNRQLMGNHHHQLQAGGQQQQQPLHHHHHQIQMPPNQPLYPSNRSWNTPTIRSSSNHYSSSQPTAPPPINHEYQEPILLIPTTTAQGEGPPPPLPPRPTLPRVHKYDTATVGGGGGGGGRSPRHSPAAAMVATTVARFHGAASPAQSLSPASQSKYSRTLQNPSAQFPRRTFRRDDYDEPNDDDHDGDDESNGLEEDDS